MTLTDKCKEDFEKWFLTDDNNGTSYVFGEAVLKFTESITEKFYSLPEPMKYGVYVNFFDEKGIIIDVQPLLDYNTKCYTKVYSVIANVIPLNITPKQKGYNREPFECKSRQEARKQAIEKANEIYNEKL